MPQISSLTLALLAALSSGAAAEPVRVALSDKRWALEADLGNADVRENKAIEDGSAAKLLITRERDGLTLSVYLEKMPELKNAKACRDYYWKRKRQDTEAKTEVKLSESHGAARVAYTVADFDGMRIVQRHVHAYLWKDAVCADAHLIMVGYKPSDQKALETVLKSLKFVKIP